MESLSTDTVMHYLPVIICLSVLAYLIGPILLSYWRQWRAPHEPFWLRYKPTGKVLYFPPHYESQAINDLLAGLNEIPEGVPLGSPLFERFSALPADLTPTPDPSAT